MKINKTSIQDAMKVLSFEFEGTTVYPVAFHEPDPVILIENVCQSISVFATWVGADEGDLLGTLSNSAFGSDVVYQACTSLKWQLQLASRLTDAERVRALDALAEATQLRGGKLAPVPSGAAVPKKPAVALDKKSWDAGYQAGLAGDCSAVLPGYDAFSVQLNTGHSHQPHRSRLDR